MEIPIPIPIGMDYTITASGSVLKQVRCEECGTDYVYALHRSAQGAGHSFLFVDNEGAAQRATSRAAEKLLEKLRKSVDVVPCPVCGRIQGHMIPRARQLRYRWMWPLSVGLLLGGGLLFPVTAIVGGTLGQGGQPPSWALPLALTFLFAGAIGGIGGMIARPFIARRYDPNSTSKEHSIEQGVCSICNGAAGAAARLGCLEPALFC